MKIIEVITDFGYIDTIISIAEQYSATDVWHYADMEERHVVCLLVKSESMQVILDSIQKTIKSSDISRVVVIPVEASIPHEDADDKDLKKSKISTSREGLYQEVEKNARLDRNYILLVVLSTIVAALGMLENNVAVVIGAMVIAPLLGPNIALALGTVLGDGRLIFRAVLTFLAGVLVALFVAFLLAYIYPFVPLSDELLARTSFNYGAIALALASGAAAALSMTSGLSSVLVGVMVAVAILPPAAAVGITLGYQAYSLSFGALTLLAINIVCINLSAVIVFLAKGINPRTLGEKRKAKQMMLYYLAVWVLSLMGLIYLINVQGQL